MKIHFSPILCLISFLVLQLLLAAQQPSAGLAAEERLARVEEQLARLLDEVRAIRKEIGGSGAARSRGASTPTEQTEMQQGCLAKSYVRTGGADAFSLPAPKATASDERVEAGTQFAPMAHCRAAGYNPNSTAVTVVWEGFFKVETADEYEFLFDSTMGAAQVGPRTLSSRGDKSVRLSLTPGYWPVKIHCGSNTYDSLSFRVKRSGLDPVVITPGSLWTPKKD